MQKIEAHEATIKELEKNVAEADEIIKSDKRMWELRAGATPLCKPRHKLAPSATPFQRNWRRPSRWRRRTRRPRRVTAAALEAKEAAAAVAKAGANATPAMHAAAGRTLMMAKRLRTSFETGLPAAPIVTLSVENKTTEPIEVAKVDEARQTLGTAMNLGAGSLGSRPRRSSSRPGSTGTPSPRRSAAPTLHRRPQSARAGGTHAAAGARQRAR